MMLSTTDHALSAIRDAMEHFQRPHTMENVMGSIMEAQRQSIEFKRISLCLCGEAFHWEIQNQSLVHAHAGEIDERSENGKANFAQRVDRFACSR